MTKTTMHLQPSLALRGAGGRRREILREGSERQRREMAGQQLLNVLLETHLEIKKEQVNEKEDMEMRIMASQRDLNTFQQTLLALDKEHLHVANSVSTVRLEVSYPGCVLVSSGLGFGWGRPSL
jgi:hypothetical protein